MAESGWVRFGDVGHGTVWFGRGSARSGEVWLGEARTGMVRNGLMNLIRYGRERLR